MRANPYLDFGPGTDLLAWGSLVAAVLALALLRNTRLRSVVSQLDSAQCTRLVLGLALVAALLSSGYIAHYLQGGPRIVDAAHYYLEARALAQGYFAFPVPDPEASFNGRFLIAGPASGTLGVLFPPGYPLALAAAFRLGVPLALGPALGAALVIATYTVARALGSDTRVALVAAGLSVLCAALRYHTADTMSHGLAALLGALAVAAAAKKTRACLLVSGLCLGWLLATRPVTGGVFLIGVLFFASGAKLRLGWLLLGLVPGLGLLLLHQNALTGSLFGSTQLAYYSRADGPPGCLRYGFGAGIGCWFEHGDYVRARLPDGYGLAEAAATTLRRLAVHALDIANFAPLALGIPVAVFFARRERGVRLSVALVVGVILAYAPFYFEGSYPGGGARFFADVLPFEHVLVARALSELRIARFAWAASLLGFGLHTHTQHAALSAREGGRPMFEPRVLEAAGIERGLIFVSTDHGFALGHDPGVKSPAEGLVIARRRHDALDRLLWENLDRPPTYSYEFDPNLPGASASVLELSFPIAEATSRIEAENLWPPLRMGSGWSYPQYLGQACASRGRGLRLRATNGPARLVVRLPSLPRGANIRVGWVGAPLHVEAAWENDGYVQRRKLRKTSLEGDCSRFEPIVVPPAERPLALELRASEGVFDYVDFE